ncbi:hypothetical protein KP509_06G041800 [Ceratopteris richardii]|uniref:D-isomer specific 2-hydroxyacid dehydrogenase NAD-binding domain-containing protein n=1 Tax=Ceratopteris richardii TaxID=49495 RepID=A0A8T2UK94_CERRI|nr:hypothetical protein KP509_06G041800 [Ceratopteris richardii]
METRSPFMLRTSLLVCSLSSVPVFSVRSRAWTLPYNSRSLAMRSVNDQNLEKECVLVQTPVVGSKLHPLLGSMLHILEERYSVIYLVDDVDVAASRTPLSTIRALVARREVSVDLIESLPNLGIIANHAVAVRRKLCKAHEFVRAGVWGETLFPLASKGSGLQLGILGLGQIGMAIAKRAENFKYTISYHGRTQKPGVSYTFYSNLSELAANSDILVVACSLTDDTKHLVGEDVLEALGPEGTLINIARGQIIDECALVKSLVEKRLGGAGLDVFEDEPYVHKELLNMDNVILTPHVGSSTWEARKVMAKLVQDNIDAFFAGKPLPTPVV